jgi:hypothetical protein
MKLAWQDKSISSKFRGANNFQDLIENALLILGVYIPFTPKTNFKILKKFRDFF